MALIVRALVGDSTTTRVVPVPAPRLPTVRGAPDFAVAESPTAVFTDFVVLVEGFRPRVAAVTTVSSAPSESWRHSAVAHVTIACRENTAHSPDWTISRERRAALPRRTTRKPAAALGAGMHSSCHNPPWNQWLHRSISGQSRISVGRYTVSSRFASSALTRSSISRKPLRGGEKISTATQLSA